VARAVVGHDRQWAELPCLEIDAVLEERMTDGFSFRGAPAAGGRRDILLVLAFVLVGVGIALAIVKPWGNTARPAASTRPEVAAASPSAASPIGSPVVLPTSRPGLLPVAFSAPSPPGSSDWAGLTWRRLASNDPLGVVRTEVTAGGKSVAIGDITGTTSTTVWSSTDGTHWQPLDSGTSTTFWPNLSIIGLATVPGKFVALSEMNDYVLRYLPPVMAWASTDGRSWTPAYTLPVDPISSPSGWAAVVAAGPNGLVVATVGLDSRIATSSDGSNWALSPGTTMPAGFALDELEGTTNGYVAIGSWRTAGGPTQAAALWSADGRHWPKTPNLMPSGASGSGPAAFSNALRLNVGDQGMIAVGIGGSPFSTLWWQSADGKHWQALPRFPPLGPTLCDGPSCSLQPNGTLVGDGHRMVALRRGANGAGWASTDGQRWTALSFSGDVPDAQATQATLLPSGVLLSNGVTTWFGQAEGR